MEELNKNQIVLLTLLVSFVTSIATGIVTVTLMDQAPAGVTQTVNRIVERTVERVVPSETLEKVVTERTVIKEVPVLVSQEDIILDIVRNSEPALVRLVEGRNGPTLGTGFIIDTNGTVVSAARLFANKSTRNYGAYLRNGSRVEMRLIKSSPEFDIVILRPEDPSLFTSTVESMMAAVSQATTTPKENKPTWKPLTLALDAEIISGQTVIALGLPDSNSVVSGGLVSAVTNSATEGVSYIKTNAVNSSNIGGPLLNTKGLVIGLNNDIGTAIVAKVIEKYNATE